MRDERQYQIRVGIFIAIGMFLAMVVLFTLGNDRRLFRERYTLITAFDDISGLRVGSKVQLAGINVGYVDKILLSDEDARKVRVVMRVDRMYQNRIREDSRAAINTQGLLGDRYVYISVGSRGKRILRDGEFLPSVEGTSMFSMAKKAGKVLDDIGKAAESIKRILDGVAGSGKDSDLGRMLKSARRLMESAEKGEGLLHMLIYDPRGKQMMEDISESLRALREVLVGIKDDEQKRGAVAEIILNLSEASRNIREITEKINRGEGTIGGLITDPAIYNDLNELFGRAARSKMLKAIIRSNISLNDGNKLKK